MIYLSSDITMINQILPFSSINNVNIGKYITNVIWNDLDMVDVYCTLKLLFIYACAKAGYRKPTMFYTVFCRVEIQYVLWFFYTKVLFNG